MNARERVALYLSERVSSAWAAGDPEEATAFEDFALVVNGMTDEQYEQGERVVSLA